MTKKKLKNVAASVRQRLANLAREDGKPFQEVLQYYVMERFLHRLSQSEHREAFVLKGGLMLRVWGGPASRPTMDIDLLGRTSNDVANMVAIMTDVSHVEVEDDGVVFDTELASGSAITKDGDYKGVRVTIPCVLAGARLVVQIDTGFGDVVYPAAELRELPTLLDQQPARLKCYPLTTLVAEKFEAMVHLGELNSRVKDFFDIWLLSRTCTFRGDELLESIRRTFSQRDTAFTAELPFLEGSFAEKRGPNWQSFRKKMKRENIPESFPVVVTELKGFLVPLAEALLNNESLSTWSTETGWRE